MSKRKQGRSSRVRTLEDFTPAQIAEIQRTNEQSARRKQWTYGDSSPETVVDTARRLLRQSSYVSNVLDTAEFANRYHGGGDPNASGMYAKARRIDDYRKRIKDSVERYRARAAMAPPGTARAYDENPIPVFTVAGTKYYDPQAAMNHAARIGDAYQRRRDLFAHLKSAGFSAQQLKNLRSSKDPQTDVRGLFETRRDALLGAQNTLMSAIADHQAKNTVQRYEKTKDDVVRDALKNRISLGKGGLELLPAGKGDSRFSYIAKALEQAGLVGQASAMASRGASSGRYSSRGGPSWGTAEYNAHMSREVSTGSVKGKERGWTHSTSSGDWVGGSGGVGGSPAGQAGSSVRRLLAEVFNAYPGGEFRGALANGKLDFTEDTRGQGMGLHAGFHSSRESKVNNALVDFNNWASKQYGDYLVSAKGRADRAMQREADRAYALTRALHKAELANVNNQLENMVWLTRNGYGAPVVSVEPAGFTYSNEQSGRPDSPDVAALRDTGIIENEET